jgi:hypothetical protein
LDTAIDAMKDTAGKPKAQSAIAAEKVDAALHPGETQ